MGRGGDEAGVTPVPNAAVEIFFQSQEFFFLMMIADSPLLGQSASRLHFYDDSGRHPVAD